MCPCYPMELRCENRVDSINSGHAVRSRESCTRREGLRWHTASLSSEPAVARVYHYLQKGGGFRCSCLSAMVLVPEDELRLLDCPLSSVLRGSWETLVLWRNYLRRTAGSQSSCCTLNSEAAVIQKPSPNTPFLSTFLSSLPVEQQVSC